MLRLRDSSLLSLASLGRFMLSSQGCPFRSSNFLRVYWAATCLHRGSASLRHCRHLTTSFRNGGWLYHRRWAALGLRTAILIFVVLGLQSRRSEAKQSGCKPDG